MTVIDAVRILVNGQPTRREGVETAFRTPNLEPGKTYEVRAWSDGKLVFTGKPQPFNEGAVQKSSGDRGFWFDFSPVVAPGSYCIVDREGGSRLTHCCLLRVYQRGSREAAWDRLENGLVEGEGGAHGSPSCILGRYGTERGVEARLAD